MNTNRTPNFFLLGAPKCGTTSLSAWLAEHPRALIPALKEAHFFNTDLANRTIRSERKYRALFRKADARTLAVGEASTWYLYSRDAVGNIEAFCDRPSYLALIRDPVAMAVSLYWHNRRVQHEDAPTFECAWRLQERRARGLDLPRACPEPAFLQYRAACSTGKQLERLLARVPSSRVLALSLEQMKADPGSVYRRTLAFLGLPDDGRHDFPALNRARIPRSPLAQRWLLTAGRWRKRLRIPVGLGGRYLLAMNYRPPPDGISPELRAELEADFAEDKALAQSFLRRTQKRNTTTATTTGDDLPAALQRCRQASVTRNPSRPRSASGSP